MGTVQGISAEAARQITRKNLAGPAIEPFLALLYAEIRAVAGEGKSSFDPWSYLAKHRRSPSPDEQDAIKAHLVCAGFKVVDHPDPDPGHPCSRPYTTLSW